MEILAPVKNLLTWIKIVDSWVWEIYFWVVSDSWEKEYWFKTILNRRDWNLANISSYEDWKKLVDYARSKWVKSYVTLNNSPIINNEELIIKEIENTIKINPDALIVKDIYIANLIRKIDKNIEIHCSSLNQVINSESIIFWIKNFNISRMIFPRNISVNEIKNLCSKFPDLEFEIFIKNDWCYNSDWVCSSLHLEWLKDWIAYVCNREVAYRSDEEDFNKKYSVLTKNMNDCKVCMISEIYDIKNLVSLKIVWREKGLEIILNDIKFIQSALNFYRLAESKKEFMDFNIINHQKNIKKSCNHKNCEIYNMYYN